MFDQSRWQLRHRLHQTRISVSTRDEISLLNISRPGSEHRVFVGSAREIDPCAFIGWGSALALVTAGVVGPLGGREIDQCA